MKYILLLLLLSSCRVQTKDDQEIDDMLRQVEIDQAYVTGCMNGLKEARKNSFEYTSHDLNKYIRQDTQQYCRGRGK